jgi:hypothetical protein
MAIALFLRQRRSIAIESKCRNQALDGIGTW